MPTGGAKHLAIFHRRGIIELATVSRNREPSTFQPSKLLGVVLVRIRACTWLSYVRLQLQLEPCAFMGYIGFILVVIAAAACILGVGGADSNLYQVLRLQREDV